MPAWFTRLRRNTRAVKEQVTETFVIVRLGKINQSNTRAVKEQVTETKAINLRPVNRAVTLELSKNK